MGEYYDCTGCQHQHWEGQEVAVGEAEDLDFWI